jgi:cytochrome c553
MLLRRNLIVLLFFLLHGSVASNCILAGHPQPDEKAASVGVRTNANTTEASDSDGFFRDKVLPLLESRCFECHGDDGEVEGELRLTSRKAMLVGGESGPVIVPSDPDKSLLIQAVRYESFQMPPRNKMPDEEIEILVKWIKDGAVWPSDMETSKAPVGKSEFPMRERIASHWAWKKIGRPEIPQTSNNSWPADDIDRFLLSKLEQSDLSPAADADRKTILRRLCFDLIGLPPTIEQQDRFLNDPAETAAAMEKIVDELLASPHFGERWARHWLDLMRYAETLGHEFDYPLPYAWRYRDYVIRALNADVPYDQFVREHIAGDLLENPRRHPELGFNESIIATGFWYLCEDKHAPVDVKAEEASRIDNQIDVFGKAFLGLTIACARCHDHKFDPITAADYYALSGFLQSSRRRVEWLDAHKETEQLTSLLMTSRDKTFQALQKGVSELSTQQLETLLAEALSPSGAGQTQDPRTEPLRSLLQAPSTKELHHPLSLLASFVQAPREQSAAEKVQHWIKRRDDAASISGASQDAHMGGWIETTAGSPTIVAADLRHGLPQGWRVFGAAFSHLSPDLSGVATETGGEGENEHQRVLSIVRADGKNFLADSTKSVSSGVLSPKLRGQLHSPEFVLTHPEIQILAAGRNSRVRLCIDGYVMNEFTELLFGGCRQPIDTDGQFRWIRLAGDVKRYIGHRCHLEFLDEGDGWVAVREVRLMGQPDEVPITPQEICSTNLRLPVSANDNISQMLHDVAESLRKDPVWISVAATTGLFSPESQSRLENSIKEWQGLAERPQSGDPVLVMCDGTGEDEYLFIRGNHNNRGPTVGRHLLTALDAARPLSDPSRSGRRELVDRLLSDDNPFPARVIVNRVWQHLFGRGIVASSDNFGVLGESPTHPELLDYLADDFRKNGWSLKHLIRRLVLTRAYRMSSQRNELAEQKDPSNLLLHRYPVRRLEGEILRDSILSVSGRLDRTLFGPSIPVYLTSFMQGRGRPGQSGPLDGAGRRSIYQGVNRNFLNPFMLTFDTPQPATAIGRRSASNVPAQALMLMNNEFVHQQSAVWAARLLNEVPTGGDDVLRTAFRQALSRIPTQEELTAFHEFSKAVAAERNLAQESCLTSADVLTEVCHVLMNQKEFLFIN